MAVKKIQYKVDQSGASKVSGEFGKVDKSLVSMAKTALASIGAMYALKKAMDFAITAKNAARDATEIRSKFNAVFKDMTDKANKAADDFASSFGLAGTSARELLGNTADLLTGFGYAQEAALDMAISTNQLAVDLASFTNYAGGAEGATSALVRAFTGEREALKSLGIVVSEEMVKLELTKLGKEKLTGQSLMQAKAEATLNIAYTQSKNAIGDYARTQDDLANVERRRKEVQKELLEQMGKKLIPTFTDANLLAISFFKSLTQTSLEGTIDELKLYGAEIEVINKLSATNVIVESFKNQKKAQDELNKSLALMPLYAKGDIESRKIRLKQINDELVSGLQKQAQLEESYEMQKTNEGAIKALFNKKAIDRNIELTTLKSHNKMLMIQLDWIGDIENGENAVKQSIEARTQAQKVLNGEIEQAVVTTKEYQETIDLLPFSFREVAVAIEEMEMASVKNLGMSESEKERIREEFRQRHMEAIQGDFGLEMDRINQMVYLYRKAGIEEIKIQEMVAAAKDKLYITTAQTFASTIAGNLASVAKAAPEMARLAQRAAQVQALVDAYAGANAAFKAMAGIPIIGPALGGIAAAAAIAGGLANVAMIESQKFATGGVVPGTGTRDTVPAMLTPGELILNAAQQSNLTSGSGGITINVSGNLIATEEEADRFAKIIQERSRLGFNQIQVRA